MAATSDAIGITALRVDFGDLTALDDFSLSVRDQEFLVILGPSGCGKSTLLSVLAGLLRPTAGTVTFSEQRRRDKGKAIGYVFQQAALLPWFSVMRNITVGLTSAGYAKGEAKEIAQHYISMLNLKGFENAYPYQLSGGMQQRVGLARALAVDPHILLMDEPFGALDAQTRAILQDELVRLWERDRKTVIFVTHSIDEAVLLADRVVVMTARPGTTKALVDIDIPRPRSREQRNEKYAEFENELWGLVRDEALKAFNIS